MTQCSVFHLTTLFWFFLFWFLSLMGSNIFKLRLPWGRISEDEGRLEENSNNCSASYYCRGLFSCFLEGFVVQQCFQLCPCRTDGQMFFFFCLHLTVCCISYKLRPCQNDASFLSTWGGLLQHIVHGITLEDNPVDLVLCFFSFSHCLLLHIFWVRAMVSFLFTGRLMEVNWDHRRRS